MYIESTTCIALPSLRPSCPPYLLERCPRVCGRARLAVPCTQLPYSLIRTFMIPSYLSHDVFTLTYYDEVGMEGDNNLR